MHFPAPANHVRADCDIRPRGVSEFGAAVFLNNYFLVVLIGCF